MVLGEGSIPGGERSSKGTFEARKEWDFSRLGNFFFKKRKGLDGGGSIGWGNYEVYEMGGGDMAKRV